MPCKYYLLTNATGESLVRCHRALNSPICVHESAMIPRTSLPRAAQRVLRSRDCRTLATAKSPGFNYETGEVNGIKFASRDLPGPTTQLAVVARAGTRFQVYPGFAEGLEKFAFKVSRPYPA